MRWKGFVVLLVAACLEVAGLSVALNPSARADWTSFWNNAVASLTPNRTLKERIVVKGQWTLTSEAVIPSHTILDLTEASIKLADWSSIRISMFNVSDHMDIEIRGGEIDGNKQNQVKGPTDVFQNGIYGANAQDVLIDDVYIHDCVYVGICFDHRNINNVDTGASRITVSNCRVCDCDYGALHFHGSYECTVINNKLSQKVYSGIQSGVYFYQGWGNIIVGNTIEKYASHGIYLFRTSRATVTGNVIYQSGHCGINLQEDQGITVTGNVISQVLADGISLVATSNTVIAHNVIQDSAWGTPNWSSGVNLEAGSTYNIIEANIITSARQRHGYVEQSGADDYNRMFANRIYGYMTSAIHQMGIHSQIYENTTG